MTQAVSIYSDLDSETQAIARSAVEHINTLQRRLVADVVEIGNTLIRVKEAVGHGHFLPWLTAEFGWTERTAQNFMSVAERIGDEKAKHVSHLPLSTVYKLAAPGTPKEVREKIVAKLERGEQVPPAMIASEIDDARREAKREAEWRRELEKMTPAARKQAKAKREREIAERQDRDEKLKARLAEWNKALQDAAALIVRALAPDDLARLIELMSVQASIRLMARDLIDAGATAAPRSKKPADA